ncbi:MAG TPA: glycosyltransferase family A protein [Actinomycetota bacterium]|nr:glycosyltransferase family A protein [Actinomycetota bacterium]
MNVLACFVHEAPECIVDLVANLRFLDPASAVLLYDGAGPGGPLADPGLRHTVEAMGAVVHPQPTAVEWGRLDEAAIACLRIAVDHLGASAVTFIDSDQLAARPGYSAALAAVLSAEPRPGCLMTAPHAQPRDTLFGPAQSAWHEIDLWRPFLQRFPAGEERFPHWTFWPATAFSREAAADVMALWDSPEFQETLAQSRIWASEEVLLPSLAVLAGHRVARNPFCEHTVRYRTGFTPAEVAAALAQADTWWIHPVARSLDDPVRALLRRHWQDYEPLPAAAPTPVLPRHAPAPVRRPDLPVRRRLTCVLPANGSEEKGKGIAHAVAMFLERGEDDAEIIVVHDGPGDLAGLPADPRIRTVRLPAGTTLTAKRNTGCAQAWGEFVEHWGPDGPLFGHRRMYWERHPFPEVGD